MDNAFGLGKTDGARWIRREKLYGADTKGVNRGVISIKAPPALHYRPARYAVSRRSAFSERPSRVRGGAWRKSRIRNRGGTGTRGRLGHPRWDSVESAVRCRMVPGGARGANILSPFTSSLGWPGRL